MGVREVEIFVRDQKDRLIDGATILFGDEEGEIGGVPFAEGRARIKVPDDVAQIWVKASVGWRSQKETLSVIQQHQVYTFRFWRLRPLHLAAVSIVAVVVLVIAFQRNLIPLGERDALEIRSGYVGQAVAGRTTVVLTHGIFGADSTWLNQGVSFASLLIGDPDFAPSINVFVFEYFSPKMVVSPSIPQLGQQLDEAMKNAGMARDNGRVIFLSHSMGGIIVRQMLLTHRELIDRVPLLFFYGTPTNGAALTNIAGYLSGNPQLRGMLPLGANDLLQSIRNQWQALPATGRPASICVFETLLTDGLMVVDEGSATALCDSTHPLTANHIDLVKPKDRQDPRYTVFADSLRDVLKSAP